MAAKAAVASLVTTPPNPPIIICAEGHPLLYKSQTIKTRADSVLAFCILQALPADTKIDASVEKMIGAAATAPLISTELLREEMERPTTASLVFADLLVQKAEQGAEIKIEADALLESFNAFAKSREPPLATMNPTSFGRMVNGVYGPAAGISRSKSNNPLKYIIQTATLRSALVTRFHCAEAALPAAPAFFGAPQPKVPRKRNRNPAAAPAVALAGLAAAVSGAAAPAVFGAPQPKAPGKRTKPAAAPALAVALTGQAAVAAAAAAPAVFGALQPKAPRKPKRTKSAAPAVALAGLAAAASDGVTGSASAATPEVSPTRAAHIDSRIGLALILGDAASQGPKAMDIDAQYRLENSEVF